MDVIQLTLLGCGSSTGVPLLHCPCEVCQSAQWDPKNRRLRASAWLQIQNHHFLIDTSTDLRQQALRARIPQIDAVLYTHPHADHLHGIDELRSFNALQKAAIPVYGNAWTCKELLLKFPYIFKPGPRIGGGVPQLILNEISSQQTSFDLLNHTFIPIPVQHGHQECLGYRLGPLAYITDCHAIEPDSQAKLKNLEILVLDCLRIEPHETHFHLEKALQMVKLLNPKQTYLTHLGHELDYWKTSKKLPSHIQLAYDGLTLKLPSA